MLSLLIENHFCTMADKISTLYLILPLSRLLSDSLIQDVPNRPAFYGDFYN